MEPIIIGAGIGALGSAAQGKDPLTGALLGGATGGAFGGSQSLFGDKIANAFSGLTSGNVAQGVQAATGQAATQAVPSVGIQGLGQGLNYADDYAGFAFNPLDDFAIRSADDLAASVNKIDTDIAGGLFDLRKALPPTKSLTPNEAFTDGLKLSVDDLRSSLPSMNMPLADRVNAMNTSGLFNYTGPTMLDKVTGLGTDTYSFAKNNPIATGGFALKGLEAMTTPTKIDTSDQRPIRQGQFEGYTPTAAASNVAPQITPVPINKAGMPQLYTMMAQTPELRKFYPDLFGG